MPSIEVQIKYSPGDVVYYLLDDAIRRGTVAGTPSLEKRQGEGWSILYGIAENNGYYPQYEEDLYVTPEAVAEQLLKDYYEQS